MHFSRSPSYDIILEIQSRIRKQLFFGKTKIQVNLPSCFFYCKESISSSFFIVYIFHSSISKKIKISKIQYEEIYKVIIQDKQNSTPKLIYYNELNCRINICPNISPGQDLANSDPLDKSSLVLGFDLFISPAMHSFHILK